MEFFDSVFMALCANNIESKKQQTRFIYASFTQFSFNHVLEIKELDKPSFSHLCEIIHPTRINRPKECNSNLALAKLLHSVAHIEYNAIDLGLDAAYRFRHLPNEYYYDFIELANEEVLHFELLESLLHELGFNYGDFPVHDNLFRAMQQTPNLVERMALVHKGLEALGLDANPFVRKKIQNSTILKDKILACLDRILNDEIKHVAKGTKWLKYAQTITQDTRSLHEILQHFKEFNVIGKIPNISARLQAGYTQDEIYMLQTL